MYTARTRINFCGFVGPVARASNPGDRVSTCSRRRFMTSAAIAVFSSMLPTTVIGLTETPVGIDGSTTLAQLKALAKDESASLSTFVGAVESGKVSRVWFFGNRLQECFYQTRDGDVFHVGEGYPVEAARSSESPLHVVARVRNL